MICTVFSAGQFATAAAILAAAAAGCSHADGPAAFPSSSVTDGSEHADVTGGSQAGQFKDADIDPARFSVAKDFLPKGQEVPKFTGPYDSQLTEAYAKSTSALQRQVLEDGEITEVEYHTVMSDYHSCLKNFGFRDLEYELDGTSSVLPAEGMSQEDTIASSDACLDAKVGEVQRLFATMWQNPEAKDGAVLMTECYKRTGLVPQDYTIDGYLRDAHKDNMPFDDHDPRVQACDDDPENAGK